MSPVATPLSIQAPPAVVMVRPHRFTPNPETAADNRFQSASGQAAGETAARAYEEVGLAADTLRAAGVTVHLFEDDGQRETPDSVFPNNWFSTHAGGHVAVYPMFNASRRRERRTDVLDFLKQHYRVQDVIDYSGLEHDNLFLEGTGAMVLDHLARVAFTARSNRADPLALERFATHFNYEPLVFDTADALGVHYVMDDQLGLLELPQRLAELRERLAGIDVIYQTIDIDGLPHAMAPGVSAPAARGVPMEVVEPLLDAVAATGKLKLMDVAELSPPLDRDNVTARVASA